MGDLIATINQDSAPVIYRAGGLGVFFDHIAAQVADEVVDITTKAGRDRLSSLAVQVSRSKTAVEKPGREYLKKIKELPREIEKELKVFVDQCDALRDQVRAPLTAWETEQREILERHNAELERIKTAGFTDYETAAEAKQIISDLSEYDFEAIDDERRDQYVKAVSGSLFQLNRLAIQLEKAEADARELAELRAKQAEAEQRERERKIAEQAAEQERQRAEHKLKMEREEFERKQNAARWEAEQAEKAAAEKIRQANEQAERAVEIERQRVAQEQQIAAAQERDRIAAAERAAANKAHQRKINGEIVDALMALGCSESIAKEIVIATAKNKITNLKITY